MATAVRGHLVESELLLIADLVFVLSSRHGVCTRKTSSARSSVTSPTSLRLLLSVTSPYLTTNLNTYSLPHILTSSSSLVSEWWIDMTVLPPPCPSSWSPVPHLLVWLHPSLSSLALLGRQWPSCCESSLPRQLHHVLPAFCCFFSGSVYITPLSLLIPLQWPNLILSPPRPVPFVSSSDCSFLLGTSDLWARKSPLFPTSVVFIALGCQTFLCLRALSQFLSLAHWNLSFRTTQIQSGC